jgi:hypothetical protein
MKKVIITSLILMMIAGTSWALTSEDGQKLNGPHYTLNIIGVQNPKKTDMDSVEQEHGIGSVIFVDLEGKSKISLIDSADVEGLDKDFAVLDKNGTDSDGALFALPKPGYDDYIIGEETEVWSDYSIYVRPLGTPDGYANIRTCATVLESDLADYLGKDDVKILNTYVAVFGGVCSLEQVGSNITMRTQGKTPITNVTAELTSLVLQLALYEYQDVDDNPDTPDELVLVDTILMRIPIFDELLNGEYWEYDNHNLKLLQVRIYPWGTNVAENDPTNYPDEFPQ